MNKWLELLLGIVFIVVAVYVWGMNILNLGTSALIFLKGGLVWFVIMVGFFLIVLGISDIKDD